MPFARYRFGVDTRRECLSILPSEILVTSLHLILSLKSRFVCGTMTVTVTPQDGHSFLLTVLRINASPCTSVSTSMVDIMSTWQVRHRPFSTPHVMDSSCALVGALEGGAVRPPSVRFSVVVAFHTERSPLHRNISSRATRILLRMLRTGASYFSLLKCFYSKRTPACYRHSSLSTSSSSSTPILNSSPGSKLALPSAFSM